MLSNKKVNNAPENRPLSWYASAPLPEIVEFFTTSTTTGLSTQQATERLTTYGPNKITNHEVTAWQILYKQIKSPFIYVLLFIAVINFSLQNFSDGCMILFLVAINTLFSFYQEYRTHRALLQLKQHIIDKIRARRDGKEIELLVTQLVPGDIIQLYPGDRIPADVRFISAENLTVDESSLTGESLPVPKNIAPLATKDVTIFKAACIGFNGTLIMNGKGVGLVIATGKQSYLGSLATIAYQSPLSTSFNKGMQQFSRFILYLIFITISCVFIMHLILSRQHMSVINLLIFSMALGITIIPEALPIVMTFSLARGALRLAKYKVIVKRLSAIEDLGSMQILCTDKTGTITESRLQFASILAQDERQTLQYALLSSGLPTTQLAKDQGFNGPLWQQLTEQERAQLEQYTVVAEHPFEQNLRYASIIVRHGEQYELIIRGNIKEVAPLCSNLTDQQRNELMAWGTVEGNKGHRVLLIAKKETVPLTKITSQDEKEMRYLGLISYDDPVKSTAEEALTRARNLGVKIKIMSGDTQEVNFAVAQQIHLVPPTATMADASISGEQFAQKNGPEKLKLVEQCAVFAHILPGQKVEIIQLLENNYYVGYIGDGINDAPALKIANVSLAVDTAADIARDASDIILLHKSLRVIVDGIQEGRIVFANMIKYIKSTLAANSGHFYALAIISLLIDFLPILPSQLLLVSILTDLPLIAISTDTVSPEDIQSPQNYDLRTIALVTMVLGLVVMVTDFILFRAFYQAAPEVLQTNWFITSILIELSFFYSIRSTLPFYKAPLPSWPVMLISLSVATTTLMLPFTAAGQNFLHFQPPTTQDFVFIGMLVVSYFVVTDICKVLFYRFYKTTTPETKST